MIKIIPRIFGGLGNQLFCYAAARRLALVNNAELVIDDVSGVIYDTVYLRHYQLDHFNILCRKVTAVERLEPFSRLRRVLKRKWNQRLPFAKRAYLVQEGIDFDPRLLDLKPQHSLYLEGYWQSEKNFLSVKSAIRNNILVHFEQLSLNSSTAQLLTEIRSRNSICLNVRRGDFLNHSSSSSFHGLISEDYYRSAIEIVSQRIHDPHFYVFSDDVEWCLEVFGGPRFTVVSHNHSGTEFATYLYLMSQCQGFVIPNSTFAWWAEFLSTESKVRIAPRSWFKKRRPSAIDLVPPSKWLLLG
jgi:hypothetical protein